MTKVLNNKHNQTNKTFIGEETSPRIIFVIRFFIKNKATAAIFLFLNP